MQALAAGELCGQIVGSAHYDGLMGTRPDHATPAGSLTERQPTPDGYVATFDGKAKHARHGSASGVRYRIPSPDTGRTG